ncbi:hypothetical protein B0A69_06930 [Chryseobacterium shigense]|nr:hypothetical protein B0A69_06930 [Chryseobacterium shigense]
MTFLPIKIVLFSKVEALFINKSKINFYRKNFYILPTQTIKINLIPQRLIKPTLTAYFTFIIFFVKVINLTDIRHVLR